MCSPDCVRSVREKIATAKEKDTWNELPDDPDMTPTYVTASRIAQLPKVSPACPPIRTGLGVSANVASADRLATSDSEIRCGQTDPTRYNYINS